MNKPAQAIQYTPIGTVLSERREVIDDHWGDVLAKIKFNESYDLKAFSAGTYAYFLFYMDLVDPAKIIRDARYPRNNKAFPLTGILAQRGKNRPNQLGLSCAKILQITQNEMIVQGLDAVDASPILYLKPWLKELEPTAASIREASWLEEIMSDYFTGTIPQDVKARIDKLEAPGRESPEQIKLMPLGRVEAGLIRLNQNELNGSALQGLDHFSHVYVIYGTESKGTLALRFSIAKIVQINQDSLQVEATDLPADSILFDIKPYTRLFFPNF